MALPRRINRKAAKGWRLPPDTVYVGRGSKWGNPFPFDHQRYLGKAWAVEAYAHWLRTTLKGMTLMREHLHELEGKNLACWCKDGEPCHADILIALANEPGKGCSTSRSARVRTGRRDLMPEKETAASQS